MHTCTHKGIDEKEKKENEENIEIEMKRLKSDIKAHLLPFLNSPTIFRAISIFNHDFTRLNSPSLCTSVSPPPPRGKIGLELTHRHLWAFGVA